MIEEFRDIFLNRYKILRKRKDEGQKIVGLACTYVPEEIFYAAGMLPIRIMGGAKETFQADAHLYSNICSFMRNCLEEGLRNNYNFLDGFLCCNACDHKRRFYDAWSVYVKTPYTAILGIPYKISKVTLDFYKQELLRIKGELENFVGLKISDESLHKAIEVCNKTRLFLKKLYDLRKADSPPISGAETLEVILAGMVTPKDQYNQLLENLLTKIGQYPGITDSKIRLLISGSELDDPNYIKIIEDLGGIVVTDDLCTGTRYFEGLVDTEGDPIESLANRYLTRIPCPQIHPANKRIDYLLDMIQAFKVEGVIYQTIKFCDNHACLYPIIKEKLAEIGLPLLHLEREYLMSGVGQMKTRVEAFYEGIGR